jgi:hypothetical protein
MVRPASRYRSIPPWFAVLIALGALILAPASAAGFTVQPSSPASVEIGAPNVVTYRLAFVGGPGGDQFQVAVSPPKLPEGGTAMGLVGQARASGSGAAVKVNPVITFEYPPGACASVPGYALRGYGGRRATADVTLAPGGQLTLEYDYEIGRYPIRPGDSLAPRITFPGGIISDSPPPIFVDFPEPSRVGASGVDIGLSTNPGGSSSVEIAPPFPFPGNPVAQAPAATVRRGKPIDVFGATNPPIHAQRIDLLYTGPRNENPRLLARVKTNDRGRFAFRDWKPKRTGLYNVTAAYPSQQPDLRSDSAACSKALQIAPRKRRAMKR